MLARIWRLFKKDPPPPNVSEVALHLWFLMEGEPAFRKALTKMPSTAGLPGFQRTLYEGARKRSLDLLLQWDLHSHALAQAACNKRDEDAAALEQFNRWMQRTPDPAAQIAFHAQVGCHESLVESGMCRIYDPATGEHHLEPWSNM